MFPANFHLICKQKLNLVKKISFRYLSVDFYINSHLSDHINSVFLE